MADPKTKEADVLSQVPEKALGGSTKKYEISDGDTGTEILDPKAFDPKLSNVMGSEGMAKVPMGQEHPLKAGLLKETRATSAFLEITVRGNQMAGEAGLNSTRQVITPLMNSLARAVTSMTPMDVMNLWRSRDDLPEEIKAVLSRDSVPVSNPLFSNGLPMLKELLMKTGMVPVTAEYTEEEEARRVHVSAIKERLDKEAGLEVRQKWGNDPI